MTTPKHTHDEIIGAVMHECSLKRVKDALAKQGFDITTLKWDTSYRSKLIARFHDCERIHLVLVHVAVKHGIFEYKSKAGTFTYYP